MGGVAPTRAAAAPTPARADLEAIWPYVPGRHRADVARESGVPESEVLKLASNENPIGPSPRALAAAAAAATEAHLYPDSQARALREAIAERHGLTLDHVVIGAGSVECIDLVARAFLRPGDRAVVGFPSFPRFTIACQVVGCEIATVPHRDWTFDLDAVREAIDERTRVVFVDNPCNPTGTHVPAATLAEFLDDVPAEALVVLDRAYQEFVPPAERFGEDLDRMRAGENLVVLRTFSKAYGLAGLRVGYALARPEHAAALHRVREAFNVSVVAQAAARAALDDDDHVERTIALTAVERARVAEALARRGLTVVPSTTNFLFVDLGPRAGSIHSGLLERGIVVRPMAAAAIATWARISIGSRAGNDRLLAALDEIGG